MKPKMLIDNTVIHEFTGGDIVTVPKGRQFNTILIPYDIRKPCIYGDLLGHPFMLENQGETKTIDNITVLFGKTGRVEGKNIKYICVFDKAEEGFRFYIKRGKLYILRNI